MEQPAFEFKIKDRWYKIWANGQVQAPHIVEAIINRIPQLIAEAHCAGTQGKKEF